MVTFLYSRCPDADFCPATVGRLQELRVDARVIAVTLDPERDTVDVLAEHRAAIGVDAIRLARTDALRELAIEAGLAIAQSESGDIVHELRWLVLDEEGRLVARFDDNRWSAESMLDALR